MHAHDLYLTILQILDDMLTTPRWSHIAEVWGEFDREDLTLIWHNLDGTNLQESAETNMTNTSISIAYQDTIPGLTELKRHVNILALSNGNFRLLLDLVIGSPRYPSDLSPNQRYRQRTKVFPGMVSFRPSCSDLTNRRSRFYICTLSPRLTFVQEQKGLPIRGISPFFTSSQDSNGRCTQARPPRCCQRRLQDDICTTPC